MGILHCSHELMLPLVVAKRHQLRATQTFEPPEVLEFFALGTADVQSPLVPLDKT